MGFHPLNNQSVLKKKKKVNQIRKTINYQLKQFSIIHIYLKDIFFWKCRHLFPSAIMSSYVLVWGWQRSGWWVPSLVRCPRLSVLHLWLATVISPTFPTSFLLFLPRTKLTLLLRAAAAAGAGMRKPIIQNVDNKAITLLFLVTLRPSQASLQYRKQFVIKQISSF